MPGPAACRLQVRAGFEEAFQTRQDVAQRFAFERGARIAFGFQLRHEFVAPGNGETPRRIDFEHFARITQAAIGNCAFCALTGIAAAH